MKVNRMKQEMPVKVNDYIDIEFVDLTHQGQGVAKLDGYPILFQMDYLVKKQE